MIRSTIISLDQGDSARLVYVIIAVNMIGEVNLTAHGRVAYQALVSNQFTVEQIHTLSVEIAAAADRNLCIVSEIRNDSDRLLRESMVRLASMLMDNFVLNFSDDLSRLPVTPESAPEPKRSIN